MAFSTRALAVLLLAVAFALAGGVAGADEDAASARERTVSLLESIASAESGFSLKAWVNDGARREIAIGEELAYHFLADREAYLTVLHVDSHGVATLLYPNEIDPDRRLVPGSEHIFPTADDGIKVRAEPPLGLEYVIAVATWKPISLADLGLAPGPDPVVVVEGAEAPALALRLRERFLGFSAGERAAVQIEQRITGRSASVEYASRDIVDYFTTKTRSIRRPQLNLRVNFETGSSQLDETARSNLDSVASAFSDSSMRKMRFTVIGHTDDVGEVDYNDDLSLRRAESVVRYLSDRRGLAADRFEVRYYGETRPLEPNTSAEGRSMNRRVEFELMR